MDNLTSTSTASTNGFFSMNRMISRRVSQQPVKKPFYSTYSDQSQRISRLSAASIGQTLNKTNYSDGSTIVVNGVPRGNTSLIKTALNRVRNSGSVAPKKKGASPFKSGGGSLIGGSFNRQIPTGPTSPWVMSYPT